MPATGDKGLRRTAYLYAAIALGLLLYAAVRSDLREQAERAAARAIRGELELERALRRREQFEQAHPELIAQARQAEAELAAAWTES